MADPICRWRNPYISTVIEFIEHLPKSQMSKEEAREQVNSTWPHGNFYQTPYQLACQLGLYYELNGQFVPRFNHVPTHDEVFEYLKNWIVLYCVPNPYTKQGFAGIHSFSVHNSLCKELLEVRGTLNWDDITLLVFGEEVGNSDILKNSINEYSSVLKVDGNELTLRPNKDYNDLNAFLETQGLYDRMNKEEFFNWLGNSYSLEKEYQGLVTSLRKGGQGFSSDAKRNKAIELYAMELATEHYAKIGSVTDTSNGNPYDLMVQLTDGESFTVEVKGTTSGGEFVFLTRNEVIHTRKHHPKTALFVVSNIKVEVLAETFLCSEGVTLVIEPWQILEADLDPLQYQYKIPLS